MNLELIRQFIKKSMRVTIPEVQNEFSLTYSQVRTLFAQLENDGFIVKVSELFYDWAYSDIPGLFDGIERKDIYLRALRYCIDTKSVDADRVAKYCQIDMAETKQVFTWMIHNHFLSVDCTKLLLSRKEFVEAFGDIFALYRTYTADGQSIYDDDDEDEVWEEVRLLDDKENEDEDTRAATDEEFIEFVTLDEITQEGLFFENAEERNNAVRDLTRVLKRVTFKVCSLMYAPMVEEKITTDGEVIVNLRDGDVRELSSRYKIKKSALGKFAEMKIEASLLRQVCHARDCTAKLYELLVRKYPNITKGQMMTKLNNLWSVAEDCGNWKITYAVKHLIEETAKLTVDQFETKRKVTSLRAKRRK